MPADSDKAFTGAIPALYDRYLGPWLFAPHAAALAARVARLGATRVLETAAGTGIATRALRAALPPGTSMVATDLNQPMLDHAATQLPSGVEWRQADATALPFGDGEFDAVVCQFGVMFFPDKLVGFREARRVLRRRGTFVFSVWDRIEVNLAAQVVTEAVAALFPGDPPQFLARTPHGHHDVEAIRADLIRVGFTDVAHDTVVQRGHAASHRDPAIGFCLGTPLRKEIEARDPDALERAVEQAAAALARQFGTGPIELVTQAHVVTASD
jgi:ubiquinone/menaquinone biosynthesis C-methylase UbiE